MSAVLRTERLDVMKMSKIILSSKEESGPSLVKLIRVDEGISAEAWATFKAGKFEGLSFTDHTILAQLKEFKIDFLISFDKGFDGLAARIP